MHKISLGSLSSKLQENIERKTTLVALNRIVCFDMPGPNFIELLFKSIKVANHNKNILSRIRLSAKLPCQIELSPVNILS